MKITVRYFTTLRALAGTKEDSIEIDDGDNIAGLLEKVSIEYGAEAHEYLHEKTTGTIDPAIKFLVNGVEIRRLRGYDTRLNEGDIVAIIPPIGGG